MAVEGLQAYTFVSLFVAHAADGDLGEEELAVIRRSVHRAGRQLGHRAQAIEELLIESTNEYWQLAETSRDAVIEAFRVHVQTLQRHYAGRPEILGAITADLEAIAQADGKMDDMETYLIETVVRLWRTHTR